MPNVTEINQPSFARVRWNERDLNAVRLAMLGFSCKLVTRVTNLSASQVTWRLHKLGLRQTRINYRNGNSSIAQLVVNRTIDYTNKEIARQLKEKLNHSLQTEFFTPLL